MLLLSGEARKASTDLYSVNGEPVTATAAAGSP
jgi:hypothetical protein